MAGMPGSRIQHNRIQHNRIQHNRIQHNRIQYKWLVAVVFVAAAFMDLLDTSSVNVALPTLAREFDASVSNIE